MIIIVKTEDKFEVQLIIFLKNKMQNRTLFKNLKICEIY